MVESHTQPQTAAQPGAQPRTFEIQRGRFVGIVEPQGDCYSFLVRDLRRERPTIYGYGVSDQNAITAVTQLLNALAGDDRSTASAASHENGQGGARERETWQEEQDN